MISTSLTPVQMVAHTPVPGLESTRPTISGSTSFSQPGLPYFSSYLNNQVVASPIPLFTTNFRPDAAITSSVDFTPPYVRTPPLQLQFLMDSRNASSLSLPVPVLSTSDESTAIFSLPLSSNYVHDLSQATGLPHVANYFSDSFGNSDTPFPDLRHHTVPASDSQKDQEGWHGYSISSVSRAVQGNADSEVANRHYPPQAPIYPNLYDSAYFWDDWKIDSHSYWPFLQVPESAVPETPCEDAQHPPFPPYFPLDPIFTQMIRNYGKEFQGRDRVSEEQAEMAIVANNRITNFHSSPDNYDRDCRPHQKGHILDDSKVVITNKSCNTGLKSKIERSEPSRMENLSDHERSHNILSEKATSASDDMVAASIAPLAKFCGETPFTIYKSNMFGNQVKTITPFYPKQGKELHFKPFSVTNKDADRSMATKNIENLRASNVLPKNSFYGFGGSLHKEAGHVASLTGIGVPSNEISTDDSHSPLKKSGNVSEQCRNSFLDSTSNSCETQSASVHMTSSGQFFQLDHLSETVSSWLPNCGSIPSDVMKPKSSLDFMKPDYLKHSICTTQGNMPELSPNYFSFLDIEASLVDERHAAVQQLLSDGGIKNVWHDTENSKPEVLPCQNSSALSIHEFGSDVLGKQSEFCMPIPSADASYAVFNDSCEGSQLNLLQIEQEVHCGEDCNKTSPMWKSSAGLDHKLLEVACPVSADMNKEIDNCKVKPVLLNGIAKEIKESSHFLPSSISWKESQSYLKEDYKDNFPIQVDTPILDHDARHSHRIMHAASKEKAVNETGFSCCVGGNLDLENTLQDCCFLENKLRSSNSQAINISQLHLVNESIFNLTKVLLAHCQSFDYNGADGSDLSMLQSSIKNLSQYLVFEIGDGKCQNLALNSSKLCGKQGSSRDRPPFYGTKEEAGCQGANNVKHSCSGNLSAHSLEGTCLQHNFPLGRNCCHNCGDVRLCCFTDSNQVGSCDTARKMKTVDAEISIKEDKNGAPNVNLDINDGVTSHDMNAVKLELCIEENEVQLHKMKVLLDSILQNPKQGSSSESSPADTSKTAHQKRLTETEIGCTKNKGPDSKMPLMACRPLSLHELKHFNSEFQDEVKKLQELLDKSNIQISQKHLKNIESSSLWSWLMTNDMLRTGILDGRSLMDVRNIKEAKFEDGLVKAEQQTFFPDMNLDPKPACTPKKDSQLDDTVQYVNPSMCEKLLDSEEQNLQIFYRDDIVSVNLEEDELKTYVPDCSMSEIAFNDHQQTFEEIPVTVELKQNCKNTVKTQVRGFEKADNATTNAPVYPDMKQAELRLAILKARQSESEDSFTTENVIWDNYFEIPRQPSCETEHLNVMRNADEHERIRCPSSLISTAGNPLFHGKMSPAANNWKAYSSIPNSVVDVCTTSRPDDQFGANGVCERGDIDHNIGVRPHSELSVHSPRQSLNSQLDQERILYKPEARLELRGELEDAGWKTVHRIRI